MLFLLFKYSNIVYKIVGLRMKYLKKFCKYYMSNIILRNITSLLLDFIYLYILYIVVITVFTNNVKDINIWLMVAYFFSLVLVAILSRRIRVTRVCPICLENRGVGNSICKTGKTRNYRQYIKGDYYWHEQEVEYLETIFCYYCSYEESNLYWKEENWQGDLTEEARIRKAAEEHRKAEEKARINAYEEIMRRRRGY